MTYCELHTHFYAENVMSIERGNYRDADVIIYDIPVCLFLWFFLDFWFYWLIFRRARWLASENETESTVKNVGVRWLVGENYRLLLACVKNFANIPRNSQRDFSNILLHVLHEFYLYFITFITGLEFSENFHAHTSVQFSWNEQKPFF